MAYNSIYTGAEVDDAATKKHTHSNKTTLDATTAAYTIAEKTKLNTIEDNATADQTAGEIKIAYESNTDTNAYTDIEKTKLASIESDATRDQTGAEIKALYEAEANTNAYTDADKTKVGHISVTQAVDLDTIESDIDKLKDIGTDTTEPSGFNRRDTDTMGILELCETAADGVVHRINQNSQYTKLTGQTTFGDGTPLADRTLVHYPVAGHDIDVWVNSVKYSFSTSQIKQFNATDGMHYAYYTSTGIEVADNFNPEYFATTPILSVVYGNAGTGEKVVFGDERHGIQMDGATHRYFHFNFGTRYESGFEIQGLAENGTEYTQISSGVAADEDIIMTRGAQTTSPFWYLDGTAWRGVIDGVKLGYIESGNTYISYNPIVSGVGSLEEVTTVDFVCVHFCLTNDAEYPVVKILGQQRYGSKAQARDGIKEELDNLELTGLPSPEFLYIGSVILSRDGKLQLQDDGSLYLDLRNSKTDGASGTSSNAINIDDLLDVTITTPTSGQSLEYNGASWINTTGKVDKVTSTDDALVSFDGTTGDVKNTDLTLSYLRTLLSEVQVGLKWELPSEDLLTYKVGLGTSPINWAGGVVPTSEIQVGLGTETVGGIVGAVVGTWNKAYTAVQEVGDKDVEITDTTKGVILRSPNGTRYKITVNDDGSLQTTGV
jgi:hypothetical protein